jgi:hypothetical protein
VAELDAESEENCLVGVYGIFKGLLVDCVYVFFLLIKKRIKLLKLCNTHRRKNVIKKRPILRKIIKKSSLNVKKG